MKVEDLIMGKNYVLDGLSTVGVFMGLLQTDFGSVMAFKVPKPHLYLEFEGIVEFPLAAAININPKNE